MHRITFIIGTGKRWNGKPISRDCATTWTKQACRSVATVFGGYTLTHSKGGWVDDPKGELIEEDSIVITTLAVDPGPSDELATHLRDLFGQECVVMVVDKPERAEFV